MLPIRLCMFVILLVPAICLAGPFEDGKSALEKGDHETAIKLFLKAAEQGHAEAQFMLGQMYDSGIDGRPDYKEAVRWYREAAEKGHKDAQWSLGLRYAGGK